MFANFQHTLRISIKRRGLSPLSKSGVVCLNQPVCESWFKENTQNFVRHEWMPHAIATQLSHICYHLRAMHSGRGWYSQFFSRKGPGLALLLPKTWTDQLHALKEATYSKAFSYENSINNYICFWHLFVSEWAASRGGPTYACAKCHVNIRRPDCVRLSHI